MLSVMSPSRRRGWTLVGRAKAGAVLSVVCVVVMGSALVDAFSSSASAAARGGSGTGVITTVAGGGAEAPTSGVAGVAASLGSPLDAVFDAHGNVVFADPTNNVVDVLAASNGTFYGHAMAAGHIYIVAGNDDPNGGDGPWGSPTPPTEVAFTQPSGVAIDPEGDIAITDTGNNAVRLLAEAGGSRFGVPMTPGEIFTIAGEGGGVYNDEQASSAGLNLPDGIAFDAQGDLVIADTGNDDIRFLPAQTGVYFGQHMTAGDIYTIAGNTIVGYTGNGGPAVDAELGLDTFNGVAVDPRGDVVFSDVDNNVVRMVAASSGSYLGHAVKAEDIYTIAGDGNPNGGSKGDKKPAISAELYLPQGVAVDSTGNLFISDSGNNMIRFVAAAKGRYDGMKVKAGDIYTIAGNGTAAYAGNGTSATAAELNGPAGVSVAPSGRLLVTDNGNNVIREVTGSSTSKASAVPSVTRLKPPSGTTLGGKKVNIVGSGLSGVTAVLFGSRQGTGVTVKSDKKVVAYSPASSPGTVEVRVVSPSGTSVAGTYTYVAKASGLASVRASAQAPVSASAQAPVRAAEQAPARRHHHGHRHRHATSPPARTGTLTGRTDQRQCPAASARQQGPAATCSAALLASPCSSAPDYQSCSSAPDYLP